MIIENPKETVINADIITIIHEIDKTIESYCVFPEYGEEYPTLAQIENNLSNKRETLLVIAENPLNGKLYRYGNHTDKKGNPIWEEVGKTDGYA